MKLLAILTLSILIIGMVSAASINSQVNANIQAGDNNSENNGSNSDNGNGIGVSVSSQIQERRTEYKSGTFTTSLGQFLNVKETVAGMLELREGNITVETNLKLDKVQNNESKLEAELSNGRNAEIKIMPSTASQVALTRLGLKVCNESNNCTIVLKEVANKSQSSNNQNNNQSLRLEYNVQIERHSKILGIFQKKMQVSAEVDAETGAVIAEHKPWWAFVATETTA